MDINLLHFSLPDSKISEGLDESELYMQVVVTLNFDGKKAYFFTYDHDYSFSCNSFWKMQNEGMEVEIFEYMESLDEQGYVCLNDLYDEADQTWDECCEEYPEDYGFLDFARDNYSEEEVIAFHFLDELCGHCSASTYQSSLVAVIDTLFYLAKDENFKENISISNDFIQYSEGLIGGGTPALIAYKLEQNLGDRQDGSAKTKV